MAQFIVRVWLHKFYCHISLCLHLVVHVLDKTKNNNIGNVLQGFRKLIRNCLAHPESMEVFFVVSFWFGLIVEMKLYVTLVSISKSFS